MAKQTLKLICAGAETDIYAVERVMKKFFHPTWFELSSTPVPPEDFAQTKEQIRATIVASPFSKCEVLAFAALQRSDADVSIGIESSQAWVGNQVSSHLSFRAVFIDAQRKEGRALEHSKIVPFVSELTGPYFGSGGATDQQIERGARTVITQVIEGWQAWSKRNGGIAPTRLL